MRVLVFFAGFAGFAGLSTTASAQAESIEPPPVRVERGRLTVLAFPQDARLARSLVDHALANDSFPGLPRPIQPVVIALAPDRRHFRAWAGPGAPEWGTALAFPDQRRIVMQGQGGGAVAGNPVLVLRHELAHLALHEALGDLPPRWFDEGYAAFAARETERDETLATSVTLAVKGPPSLDSLDEWFYSGASRADAAYAFAYRAVVDLAALDRTRGLTLLMRYWKETGSLDAAVRRAYGLTLSGFERRWRADTMRRFGALALLANLTLGFSALTLLLLPLHIVRRRRDRRKLDALLAADEAAERAARASAISQLLGTLPPVGSGEGPNETPPPVPEK